ncbi:MAG: ATP phosphoribosyltransferase [Alphaproteobacteria bacterium]
MSKLIFALPKGRIAEQAVPMLEKIGIIPEDDFFDKSSRKLKFSTNQPDMDVIRVRSFDVATFVAFGAAHIGIAGSDVIEEFNYSEIYAPLDLNIGVCRLVIACKNEYAAENPLEKRSHIRVATKYPETTKRYFAKQGIQAECIRLSGAMELAPALDLAQYIVDLTETGSTMKANGLSEVSQISAVSSRLIVNRTTFKTASTRVNTLVEAVQKALTA